MSNLCDICSQLFRGHWEPRTDDPEPGPDTDGSDDTDASAVDTTDLTPDDEEDYDTGSEFYERPNWLHSAEGSADLKTQVHHSVPALKQSAEQGCHLCNLLQDRMPRVHTGQENSDPTNWRLFAEKSPRLIGVATVRPHGEEETVGNLCLEISYFVDGMSTDPDAYFCSLELDLLPVDGQ